MKLRMLKTVYASDLKSRAVLVMNYLVFRANSAGACFPAIKTIARECHIGVNTVKRALDDLAEAGYVKKEARFLKTKNGAQTSNLYTLCEGMFAADEIEPQAGDTGYGESHAAPDEGADIENVTFTDLAREQKVTPKPEKAFTRKKAGRLEFSCPALSPDSAIIDGDAFFRAKKTWAGGPPTMIPP